MEEVRSGSAAYAQYQQASRLSWHQSSLCASLLLSCELRNMLEKEARASCICQRCRSQAQHCEAGVATHLCKRSHAAMQASTDARPGRRQGRHLVEAVHDDLGH